MEWGKTIRVSAVDNFKELVVKGELLLGV